MNRASSVKSLLFLALATLGLSGCLVNSAYNDWCDASVDCTGEGLPRPKTDAGPRDSGTADGGATDGGGSDSGSVDASVVDSGTSDGGSSDAGSVDAGPVDSGYDPSACFKTGEGIVTIAPEDHTALVCVQTIDCVHNLNMTCCAREYALRNNCLPRRELGTPCAEDIECLSNHCAATLSDGGFTCVPPLGSSFFPCYSNDECDIESGYRCLLDTTDRATHGYAIGAVVSIDGRTKVLGESQVCFPNDRCVQTNADGGAPLPTLCTGGICPRSTDTANCRGNAECPQSGTCWFPTDGGTSGQCVADAGFTVAGCLHYEDCGPGLYCDTFSEFGWRCLPWADDGGCAPPSRNFNCTVKVGKPCLGNGACAPDGGGPLICSNGTCQNAAAGGLTETNLKFQNGSARGIGQLSDSTLCALPGRTDGGHVCCLSNLPPAATDGGFVCP